MCGGLLNNSARFKAECLCLTSHSERQSSLQLFTIKLFIIDGKPEKKITCAFHLFTVKSAGADEKKIINISIESEHNYRLTMQLKSPLLLYRDWY